MITGKQATRIAREFVWDLLELAKQTRVDLEELELSDDRKQWIMTLSVDQGFLLPIKYKSVRVDAKTGAVLSMRIRRI